MLFKENFWEAEIVTDMLTNKKRHFKFGFRRTCMRSDYVSVHIVLYHGAGINKVHTEHKFGLFRPNDGDRLALPVK